MEFVPQPGLLGDRIRSIALELLEEHGLTDVVVRIADRDTREREALTTLIPGA